MEYRKKLIEVALPLETINKESSREKSIRHGHPSTLHLWWARRPLAATRAVIWASLIDDPSSHPEAFPTEESQNKERQRLFKILENLVVWEKMNDEHVLEAAKKEIADNTAGVFPTLLDPFAGGGAIPIEAQRLGLNAIAHDLNPVAVMINKAMIEIPSRFVASAPVNPEAQSLIIGGTEESQYCLSNDVRYYGEKIKEKAATLIGNLYPSADVPNSPSHEKAVPVAWIWSRTTRCPNPACGSTMPLAGSFVLSKKKGLEAWAEPVYDGKKLHFNVHQGKCPKGKESNKLGRSAIFRCPVCGETTTDEYVKSKGKNGEIGSSLMAIIGEGKGKRLFIAPTVEDELVAAITTPENCPDGPIPENPRWFSPPAFGMPNYQSLFTNRQLCALTTFSDLVKGICSDIEKDAIKAGYADDHVPLSNNGRGARAYAEAVSVYLSFAVDRCADYYSMFATWSGEFVAHTFGRQAIPMVWDFAECNPFSNSTGNWSGAVNWICSAMERFPQNPKDGIAEQMDAQTDCGLRDLVVSTDPPYYDNIGYADLSDYFYIWLRRSISDIYPELFNTMLVPKAEELVATPYRFAGGAGEAKEFFESGMLQTCKQIYKYANDNIPVTIYYAYKQSDTDEDNTTASSGWETMLTAIINAGFMLTGTWPMRTERTVGIKGHTNMLASSIVLVCRKRPENAPQTTKKNLINALRRELRPALKKLQDSNIAPVDLAQSAIGPGMGVFSQYKRVLEADGTPMTVRSALQVINEEIDFYFNEQVGSLDTASRFCVDLYTQCAYNDIKYGEAEVLANAKSTSIPMMASHGMLYAKAGVVHLIERENLPEKVDTSENNIWMLTQQLTQAMAKGGVEACAHIVFDLFGSNGENAKDLAYRLYTIAERKGWANEAYAYNALVVAWPDIQSKAAELKAVQPEQMNLFDLGLLDKQ